VAVAEPIPRVERLAEAGPSRRNAALGALATGVLLAAAEILLFDWRPGEMALGALVGTCAWGALYYFTESGKLVPRGTLQDAPPDMQVERREFDQSSRFLVIGVATLCIPLAWLFDRLDAGAVFVPGNLFGVAAASLAAYVQIQRWESVNGRRVVYDPEAAEPRPLAGPPL
jgi:hypothetical protein